MKNINYLLGGIVLLGVAFYIYNDIKKEKLIQHGTKNDMKAEDENASIKPPMEVPELATQPFV